MRMGCSLYYRPAVRNLGPATVWIDDEPGDDSEEDCHAEKPPPHDR